MGGLGRKRVFMFCAQNQLKQLKLPSDIISMGLVPYSSQEDLGEKGRRFEAANFRRSQVVKLYSFLNTSARLRVWCAMSTQRAVFQLRLIQQYKMGERLILAID